MMRFALAIYLLLVPAIIYADEFHDLLRDIKAANDAKTPVCPCWTATNTCNCDDDSRCNAIGCPKCAAAKEQPVPKPQSYAGKILVATPDTVFLRWFYPESDRTATLWLSFDSLDLQKKAVDANGKSVTVSGYLDDSQQWYTPRLKVVSLEEYRPQKMWGHCPCRGNEGPCPLAKDRGTPCTCSSKECMFGEAPTINYRHVCGCNGGYQCNCNGVCHCHENIAFNRLPVRWVQDDGVWYLYRGQTTCLGAKFSSGRYYPWTGTDWGKPTKIPTGAPAIPTQGARLQVVQPVGVVVCRT